MKQKIALLTALLTALLLIAGCELEGSKSTVNATITWASLLGGGDAPLTTLARCVESELPLKRQRDSTKSRWGKTRFVPGEGYLVRDDLRAQRLASAVDGPPQSLLFSMQIADPQLIDEEAPGRMIWGDNVVNVLWRPFEMYSVQLLEMFIRTTNHFSAAYRPFDMVLFTGDNINNNSAIELRWFLGVLEGAEVHPDSGDDDDPVPGPQNDAHDRFFAHGLQYGVPWYTVMGNHDGLVEGILSASEPNGDVPPEFKSALSRAADLFGGKFAALVGLVNELLSERDYCGKGCFNHGTPPEQLAWLKSDHKTRVATGDYTEIYVAPAADPPAFLLAQNRAGLKQPLLTGPGARITPDANRRHLTRGEWVATHFGGKTKPYGHGFTEKNLRDDTAYWATDPVPGMPLRLIALNTTSRSLRDGGTEATLDRKQFDRFLVPELEKAQQQGKLIVITAHHGTARFFNGLTAKLFSSKQADEKEVTRSELIATLKAYPNVILYLAGHTHYHKISAHKGKTAEHGFWEIVTASIFDWPQQSRIVEIVDNRDGTGTIIATVVDFEDDGTWVSRLAQKARFWATYDIHNGNGILMSKSVYRAQAKDRNVQLRFVIPTGVRKRLNQRYASGTSAQRPVQSLRFVGAR